MMTGSRASAPGLLLVHGEVAVRTVLSQRLARAGYEVSAGSVVDDVVETLPAVDLVLLQVGGPLGLQPLDQVREISDTPVIGLLDDDEIGDLVDVIEAGADDCLSRPISARELVARIGAVLRRSGPRTGETLEFGRVTIDARARQAWRDGELLPLPSRQFDLLLYFSRHPNEVLTRARLLEEVWGSSSSWQTEDTVTEHVFRLRQHLEDDPREPKTIQTVRGVGYRFAP
jgi:DNA-binding response OmpR family regulator